jgi:malic enzyme
VQDFKKTIEETVSLKKFTKKGNLVASISNGAPKPVMEGKSVLFKEFANVNCIELCVDAKDPGDFINIIKLLAPSFGAINLEDIKGPNCFYVEEKLKESISIPIFHDELHGTAIVCLAAIINACHIAEKDL